MPKSAAEIADEVTGASPATTDDDDDPRLAETWEFEFNYQDARGRSFRGTFRNHIPSVLEQGRIEAVRARFVGNAPVDSIEPGVNAIMEAVAHMEVTLDRKERPGWAKDLGALKDPHLIAALYAKVVEHNQFFRGLRPLPASGDEGGGHVAR